jgi:LysR family glycine cleavage system transcriptional activator
MSLPPVRSLLALEAVVRLGSVSRAAAELNVSQPAVSQQLRVIEHFFGRRLIARAGTGISVEDDVELYSARLRNAFDEIRQATAAFSRLSHQSETTLTVSLLTTLAQRWLIPRLIGFQQAHPDIDIRLKTTSEPTELDRRDVDISIRSGSGSWPGHVSRFLVANMIFPVASPTLEKSAPLKQVQDLRGAVLIRVDTPPRDRDWPLWLAAAGHADLQPRAWQTYASSSQALEAATAGLGVAMGHTPFVADSLVSGGLLKPFGIELHDEDGDYFLVSRRQRETPRRITLFRNWLLDTAAHAEDAGPTLT